MREVLCLHCSHLVRPVRWCRVCGHSLLTLPDLCDCTRCVNMRAYWRAENRKRADRISLREARPAPEDDEDEEAEYGEPVGVMR